MNWRISRPVAADAHGFPPTSVPLKLFTRLLAVIAAAYVALCAAFFAFQRALIYTPQAAAHTCDGRLDLPTMDGAVRVCVRPRAGEKALLYLGGNSEDVSQSLPALARDFPEHALFLLHYRGFGGSAGRATQAALFEDALALFDRIRRQHAEVLVVGSSLGTGIAVFLASERPVARLVLVTPYDSFKVLLAEKPPLIPVGALLQDEFESWRYAPKVSAPTLLLVAERDEMIPRASSERLYSHFAPGVATLRGIAGATHNSIYGQQEYHEILRGMR